ncbi:MAG: deoxyribodipyrimidine photo-lyase [Verrucomicrobiota bacterium]
MAIKYPLGIHWYRRDLRMTDHLVLRAAAQACEAVCPLYIVSTWQGQHEWCGSNRQQFLCECLASLAADLPSIQGRLIVRSGPPLEALRQLITETGAQAVFFQQDPDPHGKAVEISLERLCRELGVAVHAMHDVSLHPPEAVLTAAGHPYRVFTPYSKSWLAAAKTAPVAKTGALHTPPHIRSEPLPTLTQWGLTPSGSPLLPAGEKAAKRRLSAAIERRLGCYHERRDVPAVDGTARISQDLRFGLLSIRSVYAAVVAACEAAAPATERLGFETWLKELAWREFYFAILRHFPEVLELEFAPQWRGLPWTEPDEKLAAWQHGRTGFPIVDAGMRELLATGHMHNRLRMITAMFLTKDLHYDWRLGEAWFMRHLVDGEIASNNGGWQWSAGTGADAAPYFRIQNPWSQTARYDPQGSYIKRWVPELVAVPANMLRVPPANRRPLAPGYPLPILDHSVERLRTLTIFQRHKTQQH